MGSPFEKYAELVRAFTYVEKRPLAPGHLSSEIALANPMLERAETNQQRSSLCFAAVQQSSFGRSIDLQRACARDSRGLVNGDQRRRFATVGAPARGTYMAFDD